LDYALPIISFCVGRATCFGIGHITSLLFTLNISFPNADFGRSDKHFRMPFRSAFQGVSTRFRSCSGFQSGVKLKLKIKIPRFIRDFNFCSHLRTQYIYITEGVLGAYRRVLGSNRGYSGGTKGVRRGNKGVLRGTTTSSGGSRGNHGVSIAHQE
jgi:hypothetical protein